MKSIHVTYRFSEHLHRFVTFNLDGTITPLNEDCPALWRLLVVDGFDSVKCKTATGYKQAYFDKHHNIIVRTVVYES